MGKEVGIRGYSKYTIDDAGNIYSYRSGSRRKIAQRIHRGYYHVNIKDDNYPARTHKEPVHKLVLSSFVGEREEDQVCRHLNGNALDNRLENLCWGTTKENVHDSIRHGTAVCLRHGEAAVASKLSLEDVMDIRSFFATGFYTQKELGEFYGVTQRHVSDIVNGKTWMQDIPQGA